MDKKKKRLELQQLGTFRSLFASFPTGREIISEKPDFVIDDGKTRTGIEITNIYRDSPPAGKPPQVQESERQALVAKALDLYTAAGNPTVHVSIHFAGESRFNKHNRNTNAQVLANLVASNLPELDKTRFVENEYENADSFPFEIHSLHIHRSNALPSSFFSIPGAGWPEADFTSTIQRVLSEKEITLSDYQKCNELWLLIVAQWKAPSSFFIPSEQTLSHEYESSFDRVFFLNMFYRKLSELRCRGAGLTGR